MANCLCGEGAQNLGQPSCPGSAARPVKLDFVQRIASDGTENKILASETLNAAYFTALFNQTDKTKKHYPTGVIKNVVDERGDPVTYTADGIDYFVSEGNRTFTFEIIEGAHPLLAKAYNSFRCKDMTVYNLSLDSQIVGNTKLDGALRGFRIEKNTLYAKFIPRTYTEPAKVMVTMTFSPLEDDAYMGYIEYSADGTGAGVLTVDPLEFAGLVDVTMDAATDLSVTGFTVPMTYIYGDAFTKLPFEGALLADFTLYNETSEASITITSVDPSDGSYLFVIPTQTSAHVLSLTFSKSGFESTNVLSIVVP